jgi:DNA polymerase-3 subunit delta
VDVFGKTLLISGPESLIAERLAAKQVAAALKQRPDAAVTKVPAQELDAGMLAEISGGSLLASASVVVVSDLPALPAELAGQLAELAADPGPDLALVLLHPGGVKGKGLADKIKKAGAEVMEAPPVKAWELPQFAIAEAKALKGKIDMAAASALVDAVGWTTSGSSTARPDLRAIAGAVRQLLDDSTDQVITEAEVRKYFTGRADSTSYAVAEDAINGQTGPALGRLRWALQTGVSPVLITAAFASSLRNLGKYLDAADPYIRDADVAKQIGVPPWKVKALARQARDWREGGVARAIQLAALADAQVKGASVDAGFALEQLVMRVSGLRARR